MTDLAQVTPRIGPVEPITMSCEYQLPWDRQSNQTACGTTIQYQNGDTNWRIVINGILSIEQLRELDSLRGKDKVEIRTAEFGKKKITFDQLNVTRPEGTNVGQIQEEYGPIVEFQLQTKELDTDEDPAVTFLDES